MGLWQQLMLWYEDDLRKQNGNGGGIIKVNQSIWWCHIGM